MDKRSFVRFMDKVLVGDDCWEWTAFRDRDGYGMFEVRARTCRRSHRVMYEHARGVIPDKLFVCHSCDNPSCVKPSHLFLGTPLDNVSDMIAKGRKYIPTHFSGPRLRGESHPLSKLTNERVESIRRLVGCGMSQRSAARIFGISQGQVSRIVRRENWRHVPERVSDVSCCI